jgi:glycosyltransferase involved in cell wall biosynthesis
MILVPRQMVAARGIHLAIEAFAILAREQPDLEMCLLGKRHRGARQYLARLDAMIAASGVAERIHFRDPVPNREMPAWFNSAKVVLVPTLEKEGTSLSAIESMSCGAATVTTNVAGLADLPAVQCEPRPESIADALRHTLADADRIGREQREKVAATFNMANWSRAWLRVIGQVADH